MICLIEKSREKTPFILWALLIILITKDCWLSFFGIDLEQAEKEKRMILEAEINKKKPGHCELCGTYIGEGTLKVCDQCASEYKF